MRFGWRIGAALAMLFNAIPATAATPAEDAFVAWARTHAIDLPVCSSILSGADYSHLAKGFGSARVVALGEPVHGAHEPLALRNCLFRRSEEHTSELQSLMRISYAVFCLKKKKKQRKNT